jgi:hypothetical protein
VRSAPRFVRYAPRMREPARIWGDVKAMIEAGKTPIIKLSPGQKVIMRRPPGRPRVHPLGASRGHGYRWRTPAGRRMTCRTRGCRRLLKKNAIMPVCGTACATALRRQCEIVLGILDGALRPEDLPPDLRCLSPRPWNARAARDSRSP